MFYKNNRERAVMTLAGNLPLKISRSVAKTYQARVLIAFVSYVPTPCIKYIFVFLSITYVSVITDCNFAKIE